MFPSEIGPQFFEIKHLIVKDSNVFIVTVKLQGHHFVGHLEAFYIDRNADVYCKWSVLTLTEFTARNILITRKTRGFNGNAYVPKTSV